MQEHKACYGKLFPSAEWRQPGKPRAGAVFGFEFHQSGTVPRPPEIAVDLEAWDRCVECGEFDTCRHLSHAKLMLEMAVRN